MAFAVLSRPSAAVQQRSARGGSVRRRVSVVVRAADTRVNINDIRKDEPKVVDMLSSTDITGKGVFCRCWRSATFPLCNGSHVKHNKENGDNVGPLIISIAKE